MAMDHHDFIVCYYMENSICLKRVNVHAPSNWLENTLNNFALGWPNKPFGAISFRQHDIEAVIDMLCVNVLRVTCVVITIEQVHVKTNKMTCVFPGKLGFAWESIKTDQNFTLCSCAATRPLHWKITSAICFLRSSGTW